MEVIYPRSAGLDVHKDMVAVCVRIAEGQEVKRYPRRFGTSTRELFRLRDWLSSHGVTHVAMESTGVYWKPVWHILEEAFTLILGNSKHMKNVPGRKSDQSDASWIADLCAHGLIRSSFVPPAPIQVLRGLTRTRTQLMHERGRHVQRIQKVLEDANVKLSSVLTDITGVSGRRMLTALMGGEANAEKIAGLADRRVKASKEEITEAVSGCLTEDHRFLIGVHLRQVDALDAEVASIEARIEQKIEPFRSAADHLVTMPGIKEDAAAAILAEIGTDMSVFPSDNHLVAWSGISPGMNESAGKRKSTRTRRRKPSPPPVSCATPSTACSRPIRWACP